MSGKKQLLVVPQGLAKGGETLVISIPRKCKKSPLIIARRMDENTVVAGLPTTSETSSMLTQPLQPGTIIRSDRAVQRPQMRQEVNYPIRISHQAINNRNEIVIRPQCNNQPPTVPSVNKGVIIMQEKEYRSLNSAGQTRSPGFQVRARNDPIILEGSVGSRIGPQASEYSTDELDAEQSPEDPEDYRKRMFAKRNFKCKKSTPKTDHEENQEVQIENYKQEQQDYQSCWRDYEESRKMFILATNGLLMVDPATRTVGLSQNNPDEMFNQVFIPASDSTGQQQPTTSRTPDVDERKKSSTGCCGKKKK